MRRSSLSVLGLIALLLALVAPDATRARPAWPSVLSTVQTDVRPAFTLRRDAFGVPHIYAPTDAGLLFGAGYAAGQDRLFQLDLYRRGALGQLSAVVGPSTIAADRLERQRGYTEAEFQAQFEALTPAARAGFEAYAGGINAAIDEALADPARKLPFEFQTLGYRPAKWTVRDSIAVARFTVRRFAEFGGTELQNQVWYQALEKIYGPQTEAVFNDFWWLVDAKAPTTIPGGSATSSTSGGPAAPSVAGGGAGPALGQTAPPLRLPGIDKVASQVSSEAGAAEAALQSVGMPSRFGSYAMLVSPKRTASGHPLLYYGPQMGFEYPDIVYEQHLVGGDSGRYDMYGIAVPGLLGPGIGQNRWAAWGFTSGYADNIDVFAVRLNPERPSQYWYNGAWRDLEVRSEPIAVRNSAIGQPATSVEMTYSVTRTVHGPVIATDLDHLVAYSEKRAMWQKEAAFLSVELSTADSMTAFQAAVAAFPASFNIHVATTDGHIGYWNAGHIPLRTDGSAVGRFPWPGDGSADWRSAMRPVPTVIDPPQGWLANWNNRPDKAFANTDFIRYGTQHRVERLFDLLSSKDHVTRDDLDRYAKDIAVLNPANGSGMTSMHLLEPMLAAAREGAAGDPKLVAVADRLAAWDGHFSTDAVSGTTLSPEYIVWNEWLGLAATAVFSDEWGAANLTANWQHLIHAFEGPQAGVPPSRNYFDNTSTPDVIETAPLLMAASLRQTLDLLTARYSSPDMDRWTTARGVDEFRHPLIGTMGPTIPRSNRSTWIFIAEPGSPNPSQSLVPSGSSAFIAAGPNGFPIADAHALDQRLRFARWEYKSTSAPPWLLFMPSLRSE